MRAITITPDHRLELAEVPEPTPAESEILIDVVSAGVNRADVVQAAGKYPPPPGASELPGLEIAGHRRDTGEPVVALLAGGGYAEVVAVPEVQVLPAPPGLSLAEAGGVIEVAATVVSNLVMEAGLRAEPAGGDGGAAPDPQAVLIHGGTGGIGTFAIQLAHALGARVLTTVGSDEAVDAVRALGADAAWNRHTTDVPAAVREAGGADIILDVVGGPALGDNVRMLREFGRLVIIGTLGGPVGDLNVGALMAKRAHVIGTTVRSRAPHDKQRILERTQELVYPLLESGAVRVPVHARVPLAEAARAHEMLRAGGHMGKVILDVAA
ncbi:NAD(P)H-quinone oxidoreductase [Leucobacter sp. USHLN153]|uniref:NAD(P)H-quinone oxidoreductase n=1 Tax=Leucobacter sp. USHLN153 TaxID=3081268 RepID=UPI003016A3A4